MTKRTVPARVLILATLDLGRPGSPVPREAPAGSGHSGAREDTGERTRRGTPRGHGEGTEQDVRGESRDQETPKAASPPLALLLLEKVPIALVAGARLTWAMMLSVRR